MKQKPAYGYLRVSTDSQAEGDGLTRQKVAILNYASRNNIEVIAFYGDTFTGTSENRPMLAQMLLDLESDGIRLVLIERLDRLARDLLVQEAIIRDLAKREVQLISVLEGRDLGSNEPTRKLIRQIFGAVAEYDKAMLQMKLQAARDRKSESLGRRCEGQKRFYDSDLRSLIKAMAKQFGYPAVATYLNQVGVPTKRGVRWTPQLARTIANGG